MGYTAILSRAAVALAGAAAVAAGGCSLPSASSGFPCPLGLVQPAPPRLVYPQPSAAAVSPSIGLVILMPNGLGLTDFTLTIRGTSGAPLALGFPEPAPSPLPSGVPTPFPGQPYDAASVPRLQANDAYTVHLTEINPPTGPCAFDRSGDIGTFSTGS